VPGLGDKRLLFVAGKGGAGRTTVALALGIAAARRGKRTIVAEMGGQAAAPAAFGRTGARPGAEIALGGGLHAISIDVRAAMDEYLHERAGRLGDLLGASRAFGAFVAATPGMRELLTIGKVWELAQDRRRVADGEPYDLVIADAPATGHGIAALRTPGTFAEIARVGPIANQGRTIDATLRDGAFTGVVAVALAEEMPVNETLLLQRALREALELELGALVVNACLPRRLGQRQAASARRALERTAAPVAHAALRSALSEHVRAGAQRVQVERLADGTGIAPVELPYLFGAGADRAGLETLADAVEGVL
jgi:anion-transporting  ArsA/GET3 family ATPase